MRFLFSLLIFMLWYSRAVVSNLGDFMALLERTDLLQGHVSSYEKSDPSAPPSPTVTTTEASINKKGHIIRLSRSNSSQHHSVVFAVKQRNVDQLERILFEVSDPRSDKYGKYLTSEEVDELMVNNVAAEAVESFLARRSADHETAITIEKRIRGNQFITVRSTIQVWEAIFSAEFFEHEVKDDPQIRFHRALEYTIPAELRDHVSAVFNTVQMPDVRHMLRRRKLLSATRAGGEPFQAVRFASEAQPVLSAAEGSTGVGVDVSAISPLADKSPSSTGELMKYVTPALLNRVYSIGSNDGGGHGSQAVYETIGQSFSPTDLTLFQQQFALPVQAVAQDIGGHMDNHACRAHNGNDCIEANLDVQYMMAVAQHVPTTYYYWDGEDFLLEWIQQVADMTHPPLVFSISYGVDEPELPASYGQQFDIQAMKLGVRGVTILASSGDDGAVSPSAADDSMNCGYNPSFPATSPYVTAVGGTMGPEHHTAEVVCQSDKGGIITSGGGFSTVYPRPAWQRASVQPFLDSLGVGAAGQGGVPGRGAPLPGYNAAGRGYPDVSAMALNYVVAVNHNFTAVSGTSASSPVMAGMVALVNSARIAAGQPALGWLNPALYQMYESFAIDITDGANNCAAGAKVCCGHGFSAMSGWDPVTGLGSVNFAAFKTAMMQVGSPTAHPTAAPTGPPGSPTAAPTKPPGPTGAPTAYPSVGKGWMYLQQYEQQNCEGDVTVVSGVPTGVCLIEYDADNKAIGSIMYTCNSVQAVLSAFEGTTCRSDKLSEQKIYGLGCALRVTNSYYYPDDDGYYSTSLSCESRATGSAALTPPVPVTTGASVAYAMESSFDSQTGCEAAAISEYAYYLNSYCFDVSDPMYGDYSYKFSYPNVLVYDSPGCKARRPQQQALPTTCRQAGGDDDDDSNRRKLTTAAEEEAEEEARVRLFDRLPFRLPRPRTEADMESNAYYGGGTTDLYEVWSLAHSKTATAGKSAAPTVVPSRAPTASPTAVPTQVPSAVPTPRPTFANMPTEVPTPQPTFSPTLTASPTALATFAPTIAATTEPTGTPTIASTASPTPSAPPPPPQDQIVTITVQQAIQGVTADAFLANGPVTDSVFKHAVAKTMISIESGDITITSVTDDYVIVPDGDPIQGVQKEASFLPRSVYVEVCVVAYDVVFSTVEAGYTDATTAYSDVSAQLGSAIVKGSFDEYLHEYALIYQEQTLQGAFTPESDDAVSMTFTVSDKKVTPEDTSSQRGLGPVAVALVILFSALAVLALVMCVRPKCATWWAPNGRYSELSIETDSVHDPQAAAAAKNGTGNGRDTSPRSSRSSLSRLAAASILGRTLMRTEAPEQGHSPRRSYGTVSHAGTRAGQAVFTIESDLQDEEAGLDRSPNLTSYPGEVEMTTSAVMFNPLSSREGEA